MPVFVNEVVITGEISGAAPALKGASANPSAGLSAADREKLVAEISAAVFRKLEHALDRMTER